MRVKWLNQYNFSHISVYEMLLSKYHLYVLCSVCGGMLTYEL